MFSRTQILSTALSFRFSRPQPSSASPCTTSSQVLWLPECGLLHHHGNRPSNQMAASPNLPFYLDVTTSGAELGRNLEAHSCSAGLNNAPDGFTDFSVSRSRCAGYVSCSDRTHLRPSTHCKAFLKLPNGPASDDLWHPETICQRVAGFSVTD